MQMQDGFPVWPDGEWQTVRRIGRGSYGAVYEILRKHEVAERAAMKVISIPRTDSEIDMLFGEGSSVEDVKTEFTEHKQALLTEYSLMRKLNGHSNVVNCDDVKCIRHEDGIGWDIFIRMELVTPLPLALGPEVPPPQAVQIGMDLCRALMLCAKHGIVHRDIKPSNIFYSDNGAYKLGDFGISKVIEQTTGGTKIGTYDYMAPEVFRNQPYGAQSDICSLGLVLYWLLNEKRLPFLPLDKTRLSMAEREEAWGRRMQGEPLPPPAHGSDELKRVVLKACAYDPADRYRRAEDLLRDLEAVLSPVRDSAAPADPVTLNEPTVGIPGLHSGTSHGETAFPEDPENTIGIDRRKTAQGRAASADAAPEPAGFQERHGKEAAEEEAKREAQAARREPEGSDAGRNGGKKKGLLYAILGVAAVAVLALIIWKLASPGTGPQPQASPDDPGISLSGTAAPSSAPASAPAATATPQPTPQPTPEPTPDPVPEPADSFKYAVNSDGTVTILKYNGTRSAISIPSSIEGHPVTALGEEAFYACSSLTAVAIPDGVTSIGDSAFSGCINLVSVFIPDSVGSIGIKAFLGCRSLTRVSIPDGVTSIRAALFRNCSSLTGISIPDSVKNIGSEALLGCSSLTGISIPDSVTNIGSGAFSYCSSLAAVSIPDSVTSIGESAFQGCRSLAVMSIPDSVTSIGAWAFSYCSSLTGVSIPGSVTSIASCSFRGCSALTGVSIPDSVTSIDNEAFSGCSSLSGLSIPNSVTGIGNFVFSGCSSLTSISIPNGVTTIRAALFQNCGSLSGLSVPDSVTSIGEGAFDGCKGLKDVYFGGTREQWEAVSIGSDNDVLSSAAIHFNS